jgi:hypothetical protein
LNPSWLEFNAGKGVEKLALSMDGARKVLEERKFPQSPLNN